MNKKKILFIGFGEGYGGIEKFTFSLCDSILKEKFEYDFLSFYSIPQETNENIRRLHSRIYRVSRYSNNFLRFIKEIFSFYHIHKNYDIIYCNANHASMIMYTMPLWLKKSSKIVFHSHASDGNCKMLHKLLRILVNWRCDLRIACSEKAAEWMYGTCKGIQIVYNGIDTIKYKFDTNIRTKLREQYQIKNERVIGYFSRFAPGKNHQFLVEIFREILKIKEDVILLLIGDGELKEEVASQLGKYHLEDKAILLPFQKEIQDYYNMADIFVFPSEAEGFPLIGLEAQASGLPILMSDRISKAVACTSLAAYESLDESAENWARKVLDMQANLEREKYWEEVCQSGFDQKDMASKITDLLQEL